MKTLTNQKIDRAAYLLHYKYLHCWKLKSNIYFPSKYGLFYDCNQSDQIYYCERPCFRLKRNCIYFSETVLHIFDVFTFLRYKQFFKSYTIFKFRGIIFFSLNVSKLCKNIIKINTDSDILDVKHE